MATPDAPNGLIRRLARYLDWRANPVLVRDLRLYMRGRMLLAAYAMTLAILVLTGIAYTVAARWEYGGGSGLLNIPTYILAIVCGALIPNLVGERFRGELSSRATELALASGLPPGRLVRGKLLGAWLLAIVTLSLAMPLYATAYLLGGVSPWTLAGLAGGVLFAGIVMPVPQLYLATAGRRTGMFRFVDALGSIGMVVAMMVYAPLLVEVLTSYHDEYRVIYAVSVVAAVLVFGFLHIVTVSRLRSEAEDREVPPRRALAMATVLGWAGAVATVIACRKLNVLYYGIDWDGITAIASLCAGYPLAWGVYIISHGNAARPRLMPSSGSRVRRWLGAAGPDSLTAFFVVASVALLAAGMSGGFCQRGFGSVFALLANLLAPLMAVAYGLAVYQLVVRRVLRGVPGFGMLASTILVVNVVLAVPGYFFLLIATRLHDHFDQLYYFLPIGLLMAGSKDLYDGVWTGMAVFAALIVLLLPSVWRAWRDAGRPGRDRDGR